MIKQKFNISIGFIICILGAIMPLKFGSMAAMVEVSSLFPNSIFEALIITWPAHLLGIFSGILLIFATINNIINKHEFSLNSSITTFSWCILLPIVSCLGIIGSSSSDNWLSMLSHICAIASFVATVFLFISCEKNKIWCKFILYSIAISTIIVAISGLNQYFYGFKETLDYTIKQHQDLGIELNHVMKAKLMDNRVFSTFVSSGVLSGFLLLITPICIVGAWKFGKHFEPQKISIIIMTSITTILLTLCFLLARSRSAFLCAIIAVGCYLWSLPKLKKYRLWFVVGVAITIIGGAFYIHQFGRGFLSANERFDYIASSLQMAKEKPICGYGWGEFFYKHMLYKNTINSESAHDPHNIIASFTTQSGILAGLIITFAMLFPLFILWKNKYKTPEQTAILWGAFAFIMHSMLDVNLMIGASMAIFGTLYVIALSCDEKVLKLKKYCYTLAILWFIALGCFSIYGNYDILVFEVNMEKLRSFIQVGKNSNNNIFNYNSFQNTLKNIVKHRPQSSLPWEIATDYAIANNMLYQAENYIHEAEKRSPNRPAVYNRKYKLAVQQNNQTEALKAKEKLLKLFPNNPKYHK